MQELEHAGELGDLSLGNADAAKPNFAQAALLLHNSSHVYSRKVEYLYSLVYQALDSLVAQNNAKARKGRTADPELEDFAAFDPHQEFLLLDDVLPTDKSDDCRHINLVPTPLDQEASRRLSLASRRASSLSASGQPPLLTPGRGGTNISLSRVSGSSTTLGRSFHTLGVANALNQINTQSSNAVLRLMDDQCDLDPSGRLVLPGAQSATLLPPPTSVEAPTVEYAADDYGDNYDNDGYDDGPGFVMNDDDDEGGFVVNQEATAPTTAKKKVTFAVHDVAKENAPMENQVVDPWALLDPHTMDTTRKSRPVKLGKTLKLPVGLDDLPSECVTGARTKKWKAAVPVPPPITTEKKFVATETFQALSRKRRLEDYDEEEDVEETRHADEYADDYLPTIPLKGLVYGEEFAYLAREYAQKKAAERRLLRRSRRGESEPQPQPSHNNIVLDDYNDDDDDYGAGYAFGDDDDNDFGAMPDGASSPMIETNTGLLAVEEVYRERSEDGA